MKTILEYNEKSARKLSQEAYQKRRIEVFNRGKTAFWAAQARSVRHLMDELTVGIDKYSSRLAFCQWENILKGWYRGFDTAHNAATTIKFREKEGS